MTVSISNIAWDPVDDDAVAALLQRAGVDMIDVAPSKYFQDFATADSRAIKEVRKWWQARGIRILGMQSLLFGTKGLNVFGDAAIQRLLLEHLRHVFRIAEALGADRLVFGSPRNRDRGVLTVEQANDVAAAFFREVGKTAAEHGVTLCLEPNPVRYGANFMTETASTANVVQLVDHPSVKMQLDTGAIFINNERPAEVLPRYSHLIGHIHLSEPDLVPLGSVGSDHAGMAELVTKCLPDHPTAIEMLPPADGMNSLTTALDLAVALYGRGARGGVTA